ncbi:MAG: hypothetical protein R3Y47_06695 [Lachnospiraceae bacterium]
MEQMNNKRYEHVKYAVIACLTVVAFVITYKYMLNVANAEGINDLKEHMWHAEGITSATLFESWLERPYLFWHLCVKASILYLGIPAVESTAFICGLFVVATSLISFWIVERIVEYSSPDSRCGTGAAVVASILTLVMPLYLSWDGLDQYIGPFSVNPIHNPTHMAVKPFGLLAFAYAVDLFLRYRGKKTMFVISTFGQKYLYIWFASALFMMAFTKPTFMYMLLPAGGLYVLAGIAYDCYKKSCNFPACKDFIVKLTLASMPSIIYLLIEYAAFYMWGGTNEDASIAIYPLFYTWNLYSDNILKSIILAMAFPLWMVVSNIKYFMQSVEGKLALLSYTVGVLEFALFVETGDKLSHANFAWCMMSGMLLLWIVAAAKLVELTYSATRGKSVAISVTFGWSLLMLHLFAGLYYINPYMYII